MQRVMASPAGASGDEPRLVRRFELPRPFHWLRARAAWPCFYAAGVSAKRLTVVRGAWDGELQSASWNCPGLGLASALIVEPVCGWEPHLIVSVPGRDAFKHQPFPATDRSFAQPCAAGTPTWLAPDAFPVAANDTGIWSVHVASGQAVLSCFHFNGMLLSSLDITEALLGGATRTEETRACLTACPAGAAVALGDRLVIVLRDRTVLKYQLPGQVTQLLPPLEYPRVMFAALLVHGATIYCLGAEHLTELSRDGAFVGGAWTRSGKLILITEREGRILKVDERGAHSVKRFAGTDRDWFAALPAGEPDEFAIFGASGRVTVYQVP